MGKGEEEEEFRAMGLGDVGRSVSGGTGGVEPVERNHGPPTRGEERGL